MPAPAPAPTGRRERKKARLRQQIVETALTMFRERGYDATRIEDINEALDISRTTFFRYFPSKDAVLRDYILEFRTGGLANALADTAPVPDRLRRFYLDMAKASQEDLPVLRATVLTGVLAPSRDFHPRYIEQFTQLQELMAEGQRRGEMTRDFTPRQLARYLETLNYTVVAIWAVGLISRDALIDEVGATVEFFLRSSRLA